MQTILGAGGAIAVPLARELTRYTDTIRLVSRNPRKVNDKDTLFAADLKQREQVLQAVDGSEIVYLTAGLRYSSKIWEQEWPLIMRNVIEACIAHKARLVFVDNVYMYAPDELSDMTEASRIAPLSRKGKVRAALVDMIFEAVGQKRLTALIARSADFYGPSVSTSVLTVGVLDKFRKRQKAFWQSDAAKVHSFTYTPDAAKAVAILGNTPDAYNEVWHLPTSAEKWTGEDFIHKIAAEMHIRPRYYILSKTMMAILGIFSPVVGELKEMQYQYDRDYFFNSSKFEKKFSFTPISYEEGIRAILKA